jgi:hypothetical protein
MQYLARDKAYCRLWVGSMNPAVYSGLSPIGGFVPEDTCAGIPDCSWTAGTASHFGRIPGSKNPLADHVWCLPVRTSEL